MRLKITIFPSCSHSPHAGIQTSSSLPRDTLVDRLRVSDPRRCSRLLFRLGCHGIGRRSAGHILLLPALGRGRRRRRCGSLTAEAAQDLVHPRHLIQTESLVQAAARLLLLELGQPPGLVVDVLDLPLAGGVEVDDPLARRGVAGLLKVRVEPGEQGAGALRDAVAGVGGAGVVGGVRPLVELAQRLDEARRDVVLLVERDRLLQALVGHQVAVRQYLGQDARARLLLLRQHRRCFGGPAFGRVR
ncbi:hypothetical protein VTG60DRAFT_2719 [Thermothelomyces hinnuleus]